MESLSLHYIQAKRLLLFVKSKLSLAMALHSTRLPATRATPSSARAAAPACGCAGLDDYLSLINQCWAQDPTQRPDFTHIIAALKWVQPWGWGRG